MRFYFQSFVAGILGLATAGCYLNEKNAERSKSTTFDLSAFKRDDLKRGDARPVEVVNPGFQQGTKGWELHGTGEIDPTGGRSNTAALKYRRTDPKSYKLVQQTFYNLKPNKFYRFGAWIKTKDVKAFKGGGAGLCLEFRGPLKNGKREYLSGNFLTGVSGTKDWTLVSAVKRIPPNAEKAHLSLYLWKGATGTAWYDDVFLVEQGSDLWTAYTLSPYNTPIDGKCSIIMFYDSEPIMRLAPEGALYGQLDFKELNQTFCVQIKNNKAVFNLKGVPEGDYNTTFHCLDTSKKSVLYSKRIPITISKTPLKRKVAIDDRRRTWVDGELFLPIGVYTAGLKKRDIDILSAAGVNCVLPYSSMFLRFDRKPHSINQIRGVMDYCAKKNVKIIFSCKDVGSKNRWGLNEWHGAKGQTAIITKLTREFKEHPALLAWYTNDEQPLSEIPRLTRARQLFNKLDPDHPTYAVDYKAESFPMFGPTADIFGGDDYSIRKKTGNSQVRNEYELKQLAKMELPIWVVPQMLNIGAFYGKNKKECAEKARNPTEDEMRSMALLAAYYGAKGFIFFHYDYLKSWKLPKNNFNTEWPKFCKVVKTLHKLTPFILSDESDRKLKFLSMAGQVRGCVMTNNAGKKAVLLTTIGPGASKASFQLDGKYKSEYGKTTCENGKYTFKGKGITSDVLYSY